MKKIHFIIIGLSLFLHAALAEAGGAGNIILENVKVDPKYFTLERQQGGTDIIKEEEASYSLAHLQFFEHILEALDVVSNEHAEELEGMEFGTLVVAYEYPHNLEFNFLSDEKRVTKTIEYMDPYSELAIRSALVVFDFLENDGKIDTNLVSFLQLYNDPDSKDEVVLEYEIERGSWVIKATGYVTKRKFFITAKTKVQLSTEVAKKHIANSVAKEYVHELEKLGAKKIVIERAEVPSG